MLSKIKTNDQQRRQEQNANAQYRNRIAQSQPSTSEQLNRRIRTGNMEIPSDEDVPVFPPRILRGQMEQENNSNRKCGKNPERNAKSCSNQAIGRSSHPNPNRLKLISFSKLKNLSTEDSSEILFSICHDDSAFMAFIEKKDIQIDMMALVIIIIGKACSADSKQTVCSFLSTILHKYEFLLSLQKFVLSLRFNCVNDIQKESMFYLVKFLQNLQHTMSSSSTHFISTLLPIFRFRCEILLSEESFYCEIMQKLQEIEEQNVYFLNQENVCDLKETLNNPKNIEPPENFRLLPIVPTTDDIYSPAFLRPNLVHGKYNDTEHYLDVQYRLLREDYLQPLKDGIKDYLEFKERNESFQNSENVRVYENVHIVKQEFFKGCMVHFAEFEVKDFEGINWEECKNFLVGSLLCLSSDNFTTLTFASVVRRIPEQLKKGLLIIRFEDVTDEFLNISPLKNFVVLETSPYFEAYRHNLKALQSLDENSLPFKKYIVDVETSVNNVPYLYLSTTFDLRPLLYPLDSKFIKSNEITDGEFEFQYEVDTERSNDLESVQLLNDSNWPSASHLNLDDSQYLALKAALTKEFVIIQGPPGTGKTYIGLRIAQLLLHNLNKWFTRDMNFVPILVVSNTNHALDNFLEGMVSFTDKIVRIGGKESNEATSKFHLCNVRKEAFHKKEIPKYIIQSLRNYQHELSRIKHEIDQVNYLSQRCVKTVLSEDELVDFIPHAQYCSLKSIIFSQKFQELQLIDDSFIVWDWLGIRSRLNEKDTVVPDENKGQEIKNAHSENDDKKEQTELNHEIEFVDFLYEEADKFEGDIHIPFEEKEDVPSADSNWSILGVKEEMLKLMENHLITCKPLDESKVHTISDVWKIDLEARWGLYKYWMEKMISEKKKEKLELQTQLKNQHDLLQEMRTEEDVFVLQNAQVIGMTTTGAAKYRELVQRLNPQIIIVEEAAEILESHVVTSLAPNTQHIILIGDHQQLRPSPSVHKLAVKYKLNISLFERMIKNKMNCYKLTLQHRMKPEIADLIARHIYSDLKNHESVTSYENIKGVYKSLFFIDHEHRESEEKDSNSKINEHEAKFLIKLCLYLVQQDYNPSQITVLATYSGQVKLLKKIQSDIEIIQDVKITCVDNYQGEENDIILISFVRSNEDDDIGFLNISNRVCVAMSRAKKGLFCIGNFSSFAKKSKLWRKITSSLLKKRKIGKSLKLTCQNHPKVMTPVAHEKDFLRIPEGGCSKPCKFRLSCGHPCTLMCHPYDKLHKSIRCDKPCTKTCNEGHICKKKCFEDCGSCEQLVVKTLPSCKHTIEIPCGEQNMDIKCTVGCEKILTCGHKCPNKCGDSCVAVCKQIIPVQSSICGHDVAVQCRYKYHSEELMNSCMSPCNAILSCGHKCSGNCNLCHQGRLHIACIVPCKKILVCGHECQTTCGKGCPPCKLPCGNMCVHNKCSKECGEPCDLCTEKCEWNCPHATCSRFCSEMCDRDPCNQPCFKLLQCGHRCIGFCCEPCPKLCRTCNSEDVEEIFFGTEDEKDAKFVQLEGCNHILEISGLNRWMTPETDGPIQMKVCPKCKSPVRANLRFGNTVKKCLERIEEVKKITYGDDDEFRELREHLMELIHENADILKSLECRGSSLHETFVNVLSPKQHLNSVECQIVKYIIKCSLDLAVMGSYVTSTDLRSYMRASKIWLIDFMNAEILTASEPQLQQIIDEIRRLEFCYKFSNYMKTRAIRMPNADYEKCISILTGYSHFTEDSERLFEEAFRKLAASCGSAVINVTEEEKSSILRAMNLRSGQWFHCPNGHVYCITECGGATELSRCHECNAAIGGTNHTIVENNSLATEMDGAFHPAWSNEANLLLDLEED